MPEHIDSNPQNVAPVKEIRAHSTFPLSHYIFGTHRFATYNVNFARDVVAKDSFPLRATDQIDSYTLRAPLMQDIQKTKEFFFVPKQCILPLNWDKIERLPALGDDVDASKVNSTISDFQNKFIDSFAALFLAPSVVDSSNLSEQFSIFLRKLLFCELFFSQGSLLAATGCHLSSLLHFTFFNSSGVISQNVSFDEYYDTFVSNLMTILSSEPVSLVVTFDENDRYRIVSKPSQDFASNEITIHRFFELARDNYNFTCSFSGPSASVQDVINLVSYFYSADASACSPRFVPDRGADPAAKYEEVDFSIDRCAAYQLVCAHYFTNDSIDYVHDADLWRQNMLAILNLAGTSFDYSSTHFSYNGVSTLYDVLSAFWVEKLLSYILSFPDLAFNPTQSVFRFVGFFVNLFGWRRSLRFGDYFVGAKARPLAVGDFSVAVNNNAVDVVDITKKISLQRLANNVNRIGNSIKEWYQKIMGSELAYDYHNPMWLASTRSTVYALKNENTNNANVEELKQVNTSANFAGRDSDFEFTMRPDRNGVIIGITYYDIRRAYMYGIDRMLSHVDRFDGFIPDMQYIGDQDINGNELVAGYGHIHGYTLRNMEYKQFYDEAYGGFASGKLPGFAFMFKPEFHQDPDSGSTGFANYLKPISPEFIRARSDEFDQFYISLAGYSNATYFHFIVKTYNELNASRPMVFAPQIL